MGQSQHRLITRTELNAAGLRASTGTHFYVDSNTGQDTANAGRSPRDAFATLDYAIGQCTASNGDVIHLLEGHSETITASNTLTADVAGIKIVGHGWEGIRPTFLMDGSTNAEMAVTSANVWIENCVFKAGHADVTNCFDLQATGLTLVGCEFLDNTTNENFVDFVNCASTTNNTADGLRIIDCIFHSNDANVAGVVQTAADINRLRIEGNRMILGNTDESVIGVATGKDVTNLLFLHNYVDRRGYTQGSLVCDADTTDANTGLIAYNVFGHADTATEIFAPATCEFRYAENYASAVVDKQGYLVLGADS